jgi:DNA-binding GntR family transcriptional regulator
MLFRLAVNRDGNSGRNIVDETLESAALAAAVELATDADRAHVIEINELLEMAVRQDDPQTYHRESRLFHIGLTSPSRMLRLMHMLESAWNITEPVQAMVTSSRRTGPGFIKITASCSMRSSPATPID